MASKTSIANRALAKVGETRVSNIETDSNKKALIINDMWDGVRDALLQSYPWNFAIKRTQLALDGTSPPYEWANRFAVPVDFLQLLDIKNYPRYVVEGNFIKTDEGAPLYIRYVSCIESTGEWDAMFAEAFASILAVEIVESITQSNTKKNVLLQEANKVIKDAYASSAIANPPQELRPDEWILSREASFDSNINYNT